MILSAMKKEEDDQPTGADKIRKFMAEDPQIE
ncbi:MAG: hypothetical protein ACJAT6_001886, partial [Akkermansiaceae bacterium]